MVLAVEIVADSDTLRGLERELRLDPDLRGTRLSRVRQVSAPDTMGFIAEALQWATDNNALLSALAGGVAGYLARQRNPTRITVRIGDREVDIQSDRLKDPDALAREMLRRLEGPGV